MEVFMYGPFVLLALGLVYLLFQKRFVLGIVFGILLCVELYLTQVAGKGNDVEFTPIVLFSSVLVFWGINIILCALCIFFSRRAQKQSSPRGAEGGGGSEESND